METQQENKVKPLQNKNNPTFAFKNKLYNFENLE